MTELFVVFDLDGTLALTEHRAHHLEGPTKDWRAFYAACGEDEPCTPVLATLRALVAAGHRVEIWSGRSREVEAETFAWLGMNGGHGVIVQMREEGDHRPDTAVKLEWLKASDRKPDLIFEDRTSVVAMWREQGIVCAQVAPGNF